eukprot:351996-Chlamydomonas_euryale.AAC.5
MACINHMQVWHPWIACMHCMLEHAAYAGRQAGAAHGPAQDFAIRACARGCTTQHHAVNAAHAHAHPDD